MSEPKASHAVWSRVIAILFAIVLPLSTIAAWAVTTVTNTDRWVATLHPLATDPTITNYIGQQGAQAIVTDLNVEQRVRDALPSSASFLAATITAEVQKTINSALDRALASPQFATFWDRANRLTHKLAIAIISGKANSKIDQAHEVVLNVTPSIVSAIDELNKRGITFLNPIKTEIANNKLVTLNLLNQKELAQAEKYYKIATTLRWVLPLLSLILAAGVVLTSRPRRNGWRRLAIALTISAAVTYSLLHIGIAVAAPLAPTPQDVTTSILNAVTAYLTTGLLTLTFLGIGLWLVVWFTGPSTRAVGTRRWISTNAKAVASAISTRSKSLSDTDVNGWTEQHHTQLLRGLIVSNVVVVVLTLIALLWWVDSFWSLVLLAVFGGAWFWFQQRLTTYLNKGEAVKSVTSGDESDATLPR